MAAKKTKKKPAFVLPEFPPEVKAALGLLIAGLGKFGELAERYVATQERQVAALEQASDAMYRMAQHELGGDEDKPNGVEARS